VAERFIERMTWPEVEEAIGRGVDAVLIPVGTTEQHGPHMPLDTEAHWDWRNPLNIIPAVILLLIVLALIAAIV